MGTIVDLLKDLGNKLIAEIAPKILPSVEEYNTTYKLDPYLVAVKWSRDKGWSFFVRHRYQSGPTLNNNPLIAFEVTTDGELVYKGELYADLEFTGNAVVDLILKQGKYDDTPPGFEWPITKPFVQGWFAAFFSFNEKAIARRFSTARVHLAIEAQPHYQRDLLLDFHDHGERGIGVYDGYPCKQNWVCTFKFDENGQYTIAKREGTKFSDDDAFRLLCTFVASIVPFKHYQE